jgi:hypothetical protein
MQCDFMQRGEALRRIAYSKCSLEEARRLAKESYAYDPDDCPRADVVRMQHGRLVEASRMWQEAHGYEKDSLWPDFNELLDWLMREHSLLVSTKQALEEMAELNYNLAHEPSSAFGRVILDRDAMKAKVEQLTNDIGYLKERLHYYGTHRFGCAKHAAPFDNDCDCGFDRALRME